MSRNLKSGLRMRSGKGTMADFDHLPPEARAWARQAALPWSARSIRRIWQAASSPEAAIHRLTAAETTQLARDPLTQK